VPVEDPYVTELGRATYVFATLEWNAVWCAERLSPGYIGKTGKKTAGAIAKDLEAIVDRVIDPAVKAACEAPAKRFASLVVTRNGILHGKPGTAPDQSQRLFRNGSVWQLSDIEDAADAFAECSDSLNALLYGHLSAGTTHALNP
jgi:hypothetical protein